MMETDLALELKSEALRLGFDAAGIAPAVSPEGHVQYLEWLDDGFAAGMDYLNRQAQARSHPAHVLQDVKSIVLVSMVYGEKAEQETAVGRGKVARYARGADYHRVFWDRLEDLLAWLAARRPGVRGRAVVDTAPLLERDFARLAGLGWIGKNTMLIDRRLGSFTFLGALLVDCELTPDQPHQKNHCGTCTRCLDACPTNAFAGPYRLDARRCISYWTIEHKGSIPDGPAGSLDAWVFGCDVCQDVCPWNRKAPSGRAAELAGRPEWTDPDLIAWLERPPDEWTAALKNSALSRAKRVGLMRNAALVLGTRRTAEAVPALVERFLDQAEDPVVRAAAAWALERIGTEKALGVLRLAAPSDGGSTGPPG